MIAFGVKLVSNKQVPMAPWGYANCPAELLFWLYASPTCLYEVVAMSPAYCNIITLML